MFSLGFGSKAAKAALTKIVAGGMDAKALAKRLPELAATGKRFRTTDFAREFDNGIIQPALAVRAKQRGRGWLVDGLVRFLAFLAWFVSWLLMRLATRFIYFVSTQPTFEILGKLGGAVETRPTPKKLVLKSTPRRPPNSPPSTPSPSTTDFEALLPLTHRERSRAAAVARAVDAYLETRSGRARKAVVEAARRSAPLADEVYCRLLLVCTDQAWELLGAVADCRAPSDAALCGVVREAAVGARAAGVVGAMDAALSSA